LAEDPASVGTEGGIIVYGHWPAVFRPSEHCIHIGPCLFAKAMLNYAKHICLWGSCAPLQWWQVHSQAASHGLEIFHCAQYYYILPFEKDSCVIKKLFWRVQWLKLMLYYRFFYGNMSSIWVWLELWKIIYCDVWNQTYVIFYGTSSHVG
jgi:hypothetical protein